MFGITFLLEIVALLTGIILLKQISPNSYKLIVLLLALTVVNEGLSHYGVYKKIGVSKVYFYNLFFLIEFLFVGIIYFPVIKSKRIYILIAISCLSLLFLLLRESGLGIMNPDYISVICLGLVFFSVYYLLELIYRDVIVNVKSDPLFFFSIGLIAAQLLLFFYINAKRVDSFRNDAYAIEIFRVFNLAGNVIYYLSICYSFLCTLIFPKQDGI